MENYNKTSRRLSDVMTERDTTINDIKARLLNADPKLPWFNPLPALRESPKVGVVPFPTNHSVASRASVARLLCPDGIAKQISVLAHGLDNTEIQRVFDLSSQVNTLKAKLSSFEVEILETVPEDAAAAIEKLSFISNLMMDHHDFEVDYFAYLIEECSKVVKEAMLSPDV
jgi:hypothetical protein